MISVTSDGSETPPGVSTCVFCDLLVSGAASWVVRDDPAAAAFRPLPASELAPGHTLVVSRAHAVGVLDAEPSDLASVMRLVQRVGKAMVEALGATGVVVLNASGPHSGQSVSHLHFHVVPSWPDDVIFWPTQRSRRWMPGLPHELLSAALSNSTAS